MAILLVMITLLPLGFRAAGVDAKAVSTRLAAGGLLLFDTGPDTFRAVTHLMISKEQIAEAGRLLQKALT